ncbi:MAG: nucleotidyl transferase AbiEii/AbiGii toxin family protein [Pirellulales bacterium]|nr:nucleotidyl transferase AbiEii/AbiGii toxin family protein [Pirellulales bacterium]
MANPAPRYHEDAELFRAALDYTAAETGFSARLIEKDYYCTVALVDLTSGPPGLVFKGGTCLSKIHADFYRLSEDLDFSLSVPCDAQRRTRSRLIAPFKQRLTTIADRQASLRVLDPLRGFNNSMQYGGRLAYRSLVTGQDDAIKIEISVREPVLEEATALPARTVLLDPFRRSVAVQPVAVPVLSLREAYAEKIRAALSRRDPAIRDFFDLGHALAAGLIKVADQPLLDMVSAKLAIPANDPVDVSEDKLALLRTQLTTQLQPVLRDVDFNSFDLDQTFRTIAALAARL